MISSSVTLRFVINAFGNNEINVVDNSNLKGLSIRFRTNVILALIGLPFSLQGIFASNANLLHALSNIHSYVSVESYFDFRST